MTIGSGVTSMGDIVCSRCTSLTAITVDADNSIYGSVDGVLVNKSQTILLRFPQGKPGNYAIPSSITSIERSAFESCTSLTSITIPDSVTDIGGGGFNSCTSLTSVTIGSGVTNIGSGAFRYCTSLTEITIPAKVTSIGQVGVPILHRPDGCHYSQQRHHHQGKRVLRLHQPERSLFSGKSSRLWFAYIRR